MVYTPLCLYGSVFGIFAHVICTVPKTNDDLAAIFAYVICTVPKTNDDLAAYGYTR